MNKQISVQSGRVIFSIITTYFKRPYRYLVKCCSIVILPWTLYSIIKHPGYVALFSAENPFSQFKKISTLNSSVSKLIFSELTLFQHWILLNQRCFRGKFRWKTYSENWIELVVSKVKLFSVELISFRITEFRTKTTFQGKTTKKRKETLRIDINK